MDANPLLVNSLTAFIGLGLGDLVAQAGNSDPFELTRFVSMCGFGLLLSGPCFGWFYYWLEVRTTTTSYHTTTASHTHPGRDLTLTR